LPARRPSRCPSIPSARRDRHAADHVLIAFSGSWLGGLPAKAARLLRTGRAGRILLATGDSARQWPDADDERASPPHRHHHQWAMPGLVPTGFGMDSGRPGGQLEARRPRSCPASARCNHYILGGDGEVDECKFTRWAHRHGGMLRAVKAGLSAGLRSFAARPPAPRPLRALSYSLRPAILA